MGARKKQVTAPTAPPKPEGKGKKRTPQSAFDPAAGKDVYESEKIAGEEAAQVEAQEVCTPCTEGVVVKTEG